MNQCGINEGVARRLGREATTTGCLLPPAPPSTISNQSEVPSGAIAWELVATLSYAESHVWTACLGTKDPAIKPTQVTQARAPAIGAPGPNLLTQYKRPPLHKAARTTTAASFWSPFCAKIRSRFCRHHHPR